jgi:hypothetical protein
MQAYGKREHPATQTLHNEYTNENANKSAAEKKKNNERNGCSSDVQTSINTPLPFSGSD